MPLNAATVTRRIALEQVSPLTPEEIYGSDLQPLAPDPSLPSSFEVSGLLADRVYEELTPLRILNTRAVETRTKFTPKAKEGEKQEDVKEEERVDIRYQPLHGTS